MKRKPLLALLALALAGCGGSGGGHSSASRSVPMNLFVSDALGDYDHVWVTLKSVALVGPDGAKTVYADAKGRTIDLATLHHGADSAFAFLGTGAASEAAYTAVRVTLDDDLTLFPHGATGGEARKFAGAIGGEKSLDIAAEGTGGGNLAVDFDLSRWTDDGATVAAVAAIGDAVALADPTHHVDQAYTGKVSSVGADGFTLTPASGASLAVKTDGTTRIAGTLANGASIKLHGTFDVATNALKATDIRVRAAGETDSGSVVIGVLATGDGGDLTVSVVDASGFLPTHTTATVAFAPDATFEIAGGTDLSALDFLDAVATSVEIEVEGTYDAATDVLTAHRVILTLGDHAAP